MQGTILINLIIFVLFINSSSTYIETNDVKQPNESHNEFSNINNESDRQNRQNGKWVNVLITAYSPWNAIDTNSGYQDGMTSTMVNTMSGNPNDMYGIAADPSAIPYGTRIYIPAYWDALQNNKVSRPTAMTKVDDTGGIVRSNWRNHGIIHLDLRFRTSNGAIRWIRNNSHRGNVDSRGRLWMNVFIYD